MVIRRFGPKPENSPGVGEICPGCRMAIRAGDYTALVPVGPGVDPEEREKARMGHAYTAVALEAHYACVTGVEDDPGDAG